MHPYYRKVQYYETDRMGVAHHAHYIHWMEEARIYFLEQLGFPYPAMEEKGVISPVKALSCQYLKPCTFGDEIAVMVSVKSFDGVVLTIQYDMVNAATGAALCSASSQHVFLNREGRLVRLRRDMPDFCAAITQLCSAQNSGENK